MKNRDMKNWLFAIALGFCIPFTAATQAAYAEKKLPPKAQPYVGIFQHTIPGTQRMGEKVEFQNVLGSLYMNYEGIEYLGEHGVAHYFYADYVHPTQDGSFAFEIPSRTLYSAPIKSGKFLTIRGQAKQPIQFSGKIQDGKLVLTCRSEDESACFDKKLIFQKKATATAP
jgi:hypothetical protein